MISAELPLIEPCGPPTLAVRCGPERNQSSRPANNPAWEPNSVLSELLVLNESVLPCKPHFCSPPFLSCGVEMTTTMSMTNRVRMAAMTAAAVDRLVHHATIIEMNGESYRKRFALRRAAKEETPILA